MWAPAAAQRLPAGLEADVNDRGEVERQGRGLGTVLLEALLAAAEARGIRRFTADVLADNHRILRVIARLAEVRSRELHDGVLTLELERRQSFTTA